MQAEDLKRLFFRGQTAEGNWTSLNAYDAPDVAFDKWIRTKIEVDGDSTLWPMSDRIGVVSEIADSLIFIK